MNKRRIFLYWLVLLVPTLVIGGVTLNLLRKEEGRLEQAAVSAATEKVRAVIDGIVSTVEEVQEGLSESLTTIPPSEIRSTLRNWHDKNPLVRNVFLWRQDRQLLLPAASSGVSSEEQDFKDRYASLFSGRTTWSDGKTSREKDIELHDLPSNGRVQAKKELKKWTRRQTSSGGRSSDAVQLARGGWIPWFWENEMYMLGWVQPAGHEIVYGVELEMMALLSRLIGAVSIDVPQDEIFAMYDSNGSLIHQMGSRDLIENAMPIVQLPIGAALPHWQVAIFSFGSGPFKTTGRSFLILSSILVAILLTAILLGGSALVWQANRNMRDAQQKTSFVSNVSHELKTPLTTIRMYAELLGEGRVSDPAKKESYLDTIIRESQRLTRLVNNVLDFARIEQGRKAYQIQELSLGETVNEILDSQQLRIEESGMQLERTISNDATECHVDRDVVEQVLLNLVDNAIKYASDGDIVTVKLHRDRDQLVLTVLDRGPGVPAAHRRQIFNTFHRVDDSLTAAQAGSGLGLSIALRLVRDTGGDLVYRPREGGGALFEVLFPCEHVNPS